MVFGEDFFEAKREMSGISDGADGFGEAVMEDGIGKEYIEPKWEEEEVI